MYSWAGTILHVDLTSGRIWKQSLPEELGSKFLGARGINARLLWDCIKEPGIDPLSPENPLIFGTGPLTGTLAPGSGRTTVTCKGVLTNLYNKTNMGGQWGAELKFAGYDHIVFYGASKKPVYVWINDENVEIKDAGYLWGKDTRETDKALKSDLGDTDVKIACIGPAGENIVKFAAVINGVYHAAARGGAGAVMGSKKLKAIAVRGTGDITIKYTEKFWELALQVREELSKFREALGYYEYGTAGILPVINEAHGYPVYNFKSGHVENARPLTGQCLVEDGYLRRRAGCFGCNVSCHRYTFVDKGPYAGTYTGGPEYESICSLAGGTAEKIDIGTYIKSNELCNVYGLDTISTGSAIQWAMESYERGALTRYDTDGMELKFGNEDVVVKLVGRIAHREGKIGELLADGVKRAAEKVGKDSWKWAVCNSKGMEQSRIETRAAKAYALSFAVNPRGPDHLHTCPYMEWGSSSYFVSLVEELTGDKKWAAPIYTEHRGEIVRWSEDCMAVADGLGFCLMYAQVFYPVISPDRMAQLFSLATGMSVAGKDLMLSGRRIVTLEKCFNVREGADRKLDDLPYRLMYEPAPSGPAKGMMNSTEELNKMLDEYYRLHGWDLATSWPYRGTLEMLNLNDVAEELGRHGRLPGSKKLELRS